ncbi:hypothetical protein Afil01_66700 [Actinorhabdospora filicis]|uniref:Uncharacterized protein n=1 Tax=Actinorhabdospora filicis TaxID=1785913 RepID=A0A9W6WD91_9ACTN|nr:hypothetical protein Afil01_66700 [Actinorhabdospora filicis]
MRLTMTMSAKEPGPKVREPSRNVPWGVPGELGVGAIAVMEVNCPGIGKCGVMTLLRLRGSLGSSARPGPGPSWSVPALDGNGSGWTRRR